MTKGKNISINVSVESYRAAVYAISAESCRIVFSEALRELIGAGKAYSVESASDALGIDARTLRSYLDGENLPPATTIFKMITFFGASFADKILSIAGFAGATRINAVEGVDEFALNADTVGLLKKISDAIKDGRIDHMEHAQILKEAKHLHDALDNFIAASAVPAARKRSAAR